MKLGTPLLGVCSLLVCSPLCGQTSLVELGDSITQGGNGLFSYRYYLESSLMTSGYNTTTVGSHNNTLNDNPSTFVSPNEGHWGWTSEDILTNPTSINDSSGSGTLSSWLTGYTADIALVQIGTNDFLKLFDDSGAGGNASAQNTATLGNIDSIISALDTDSPGIEIFISEIIPIRSFSAADTYASTINSWITGFNSELNGHAFGSNVTIVPMWDLFSEVTDSSNNSTLYADRFHPNNGINSGADLMAQAWLTAMETTGALTAIPEPSTVALMFGSVALGAAAFVRRRKTRKAVAAA